LNKNWDKKEKYAGVNPQLIEDLAELRHNQMRAWSTSLMKVLNEYQYNDRSLYEFGKEMLKLTDGNWVDYDKVPEELKHQSRTFAYAVIDILRKYSNK
jgi:hypothetical protein